VTDTFSACMCRPRRRTAAPHPQLKALSRPLHVACISGPPTHRSSTSWTWTRQWRKLKEVCRGGMDAPYTLSHPHFSLSSGCWCTWLQDNRFWTSRFGLTVRKEDGIIWWYDDVCSLDRCAAPGSLL